MGVWSVNTFNMIAGYALKYIMLSACILIFVYDLQHMYLWLSSSPPPLDPTLTVDSVSHIMEKVEPEVKAQVWEDACAISMEKEKMKELCMSGKEDECADLYVNYNRYSSWEWLARSLYRHHQVAAVEEVKSYLPPRGEPCFTHVAVNVT